MRSRQARGGGGLRSSRRGASDQQLFGSPRSRGPANLAADPMVFSIVTDRACLCRYCRANRDGEGVLTSHRKGAAELQCQKILVLARTNLCRSRLENLVKGPDHE